MREADALAEAGHDVRVIAVRKRPEQSRIEAGVSTGRWRLERINIEPVGVGRRTWLLSGVRQQLARALWERHRGSRHLAGVAYARTFSETLRHVVAEPTDLVIAHTQPMLAVAWRAARQLECSWGFDCEDILSEEYADRGDQDLIRHVERTFIRDAAYVTVASSEFSSWLEQHYAVRRAVFISNAPSMSEAPPRILSGFPETRPRLSLYWFSMSIGPMRGLEDALRALAAMKSPAELHVRGAFLPGYEAQFRAHTKTLGIADRVYVHDLVAPDAVVREAAAHDVGLVLSQPCCENHELWMPNKLFAYLMAGLAIAATSTRGHRAALAAALGVGFEYSPGDAVALAAGLDALAANPERLQSCRRAAFAAARARFNWEAERSTLLDAVEAAVGRDVPALAGAGRA